MPTHSYVGGLPYTVTEAQRKQRFATHGAVTAARVITDPYTRQTRGCGAVDMTSPDEAQRAMQTLHGMQLDERTLTVQETRAQEKRGNIPDPASPTTR